LRRTAVLMAALALLLTGCDQVVQLATEKAVEQATGYKIAQRGDTVTITDKAGETITLGSGVPDSLRSFPVPQGFKTVIDKGGSFSDKQNEMAVAAWSGTGTLRSVADFYQKTMTAQGWEQELVQEVGDMIQHKYVTGNRQALLTISKDTTDKQATGVNVDVMVTIKR
jgi:hypothetical protein